MKTLKKLLAILISITLMAGIMIVPVSAAQSFAYEHEAEALYELGLFKGVSNTEYRPNLEANLERQEGAVLVLRLFNLEEDANKISEKEAKAILNEKFEDADEIGNWAVKAIAYAVQKGIINGRPDGNFAPKDRLLGKEFAKMILEQLGQQYDFHTSCADLAAVSNLSAIEAIKFNEKYLIRDDVVGISFASLGGVYASSGKTVLAVLGEDVAFKAKAIELGLVEVAKIITSVAPIQIKVGESLKLPSKVNVEYSDGSTANVLVTWDNDGVNKDVAGEYIAIGNVANFDGRIVVSITVKEDVLKVDSVTADTLKQVIIVYNQDVSENAEVAKKDNYKLDIAKKIEAVKVEGNTVILEVQNSGSDVANQQKAKLTIGEKILGTKQEVTFTFFDATLPEVLSMEVTGPKSVNITFSEPIGLYGKITLKSGSSTLSVNTTFTGKGTSEITVPLYSTFVNGRSYEITVRGFEDYAGYGNIIKTMDFVYEKDETPPMATISEVTQEYVKVMFNKPVKGLSKAHFSHTFSAWKSISLTKTDAFVKATETSNPNLIKTSDSVKEVYVWFYNDGTDRVNERAIPEGTTSFRILTKAGDYEIKDEWGNKLGEVNVSITVTSDKTAPEVSEIEVVAENQIKVKFTKNVTFNKDNIEVLDTNGEKIKDVKLSVLESGTGKEFNIRLGTNLSGKAILVNIKNVEDTTLNANKMVLYSEVIEITDKTPPKVNLITYDVTFKDGDTYLYVFFDEVLDYESAMKVSNYYVYDGSSYNKLTGSTSFFSGEKIVRIALTQNQYNKVKGLKSLEGKGLFIVGVKDISGNEIVPIIKTIAGTQSEANRPAIKENTVKATAADKIEFVFNQELASVESQAFKVVSSYSEKTYTIVGMDITLDSGNTKVILTVEGEERVNGVRRAISLPYDASGVKLEIDGNRISNLFGEEGIDKSNIIINDKIAPEMYNITVGTGNKEIFITFTEKLDPYSKNLFALDFIITDEDDDELRAGVDYTTDLLSDGKTIKVTVINGDYGEYIVKSEDTLKYIEDLEGNMAVKFDDKKVTLTDKVVPTVIQSIINDIAVSKTAAVEFSKPLNASSRTSVENKIQAANSVGGTLGFSWNTEGSKLIVTNNTGKVTNFRGDKQSIEVKVTVMDLVGNGSEVTIINLGDETAPTLISEPIKGEIEASKFASIKFSEPLFKESREQLENIIRNATTKAKDTLVFTWSDNNSTLTITNNGLESTNFKGTGESARVEVKVKDLTNHESALLTIINISDTTAPSIISGTITDEIKAKEFVSIVFSEKLAGDSKTAIENAIKATKKADNATLGFTWSDGELMLTVTNSGTEATNFKGEAESAKFDVVVKDLAQNESTLTIINISDTTTPKLVSAPIIGEIVAGNTVELVFSEKLKADGEYNSKTAVENAIKGATTAAKTSLTFTWTDVVNKVTIKNTSTTESTNFANTLVLAQRKALAAIKDLSSNSATVTVINIPETTITGSISEELPQGETELTISFMQGEVAANISDIELDKVITAVIKAAGEGANDFTAIRDFQTIAGTEQNKYLGVKMKGNNLTTTTTTFAKAVSPIFIPLDSESISTAKRIFVLTINIPVNNP